MSTLFSLHFTPWSAVFISVYIRTHPDGSTLTQTRRPAVIRGKIQNGGHSLLKDFLSTFILNTSNQKALFMAKENDEPLQWSGSVGKLVKFSQETCTITPVERQKQDEWLLGMWVQFIYHRPAWIMLSPCNSLILCNSKYALLFAFFRAQILACSIAYKLKQLQWSKDLTRTENRFI